MDYISPVNLVGKSNKRTAEMLSNIVLDKAIEARINCIEDSVDLAQYLNDFSQLVLKHHGPKTPSKLNSDNSWSSQSSNVVSIRKDVLSMEDKKKRLEAELLIRAEKSKNSVSFSHLSSLASDYLKSSSHTVEIFSKPDISLSEEIIKERGEGSV